MNCRGGCFDSHYVTLSEAKGLSSNPRFFAALRMTVAPISWFWTDWKSVLRCLRRLVEVQRDVRLALMVGLVPAENVKHFAHGQAALFEVLGDFAEPIVAEVFE